ncbi:MAG: hypothetical protein K0R34_2815 [Herbinix sp.]|nr:hypothetical protein [Herbinix sp.]
MNRDYEEYVAKRCEKALIRNKEYRMLQKQLIEALKNNDIGKYSEINISMQVLVEKICYQACAMDMLGIAIDSNS